MSIAHLGNVSGPGPMSAVRVVLFGHEIVHKVVHVHTECRSFAPRVLMGKHARVEPVAAVLNIRRPLPLILLYCHSESEDVVSCTRTTWSFQ